MRTVSQVELKRLKKKGKVRKKMGAQPVKKKPEAAATAGEGMSGSVPTEQPTPAPIPQIEKPAVQERQAPTFAPEPVFDNGSFEIDTSALLQQWSYSVLRNEKGQMDKVVATSDTGAKLTYEIERKKGIIQNITMTDESGERRTFDVKRTNSLIDTVQELRSVH